MKTFLLLTVVLIWGYAPSNVVYICNSSNATKYHLTKDCKGLENCKAEIKKVKLKVAKKEGKKLCGWEIKQ